MARAISIKVNARKRCTAEVTRLTQNHNHAPRAQACSGSGRAAVHCSEGDSLSPPTRVRTITEKCVHQRVVEFAGTYQIIAKFGNRLRPIISPSRAAVVDRCFRSSAYLRQTQRCESRRQGAPDVVIDPAFALPREPPVPERSHLRRLRDTDRNEIRLDESMC